MDIHTVLSNTLAIIASILYNAALSFPDAIVQGRHRKLKETRSPSSIVQIQEVHLPVANVGWVSYFGRHAVVCRSSLRLELRRIAPVATGPTGC